MPSLFDSSEFNENLFFPRQDPSPVPGDSEEIYIEVEPRVRIHARRYPTGPARFSLLYFHGNGEIVSDYNELNPYFAILGAEMTVCDYRGYGKSEGTPTLRNLLKDAHTIYRTLYDQGKLLDRVCLMGRSLGSAAAIELCSVHREISGCVIESGYADPVPLVERRGLKMAAATPEEDALFNNSLKIKQVTCPVLILHGEDDFLISPKEAELNYRKAGSAIKYLEILEGVGHNDMMMARENGYFSSLKYFFDTIYPPE
ncbi:MAG: alpha/beta hydrolase [Nitrospinaceae bacterium]